MSSRKNHVRTRCVYAAHIIVYVQNGVFAITTMATMKSAAFRAETEIDLFESNEPVPPPVVVAAAAAPTGRRLGARGEFSVPVALCPAVGPRTIGPVVPDTPSPLSPREGERLISLIFSRSEIIQGMKKKTPAETELYRRKTARLVQFPPGRVPGAAHIIRQTEGGPAVPVFTPIPPHPFAAAPGPAPRR